MPRKLASKSHVKEPVIPDFQSEAEEAEWHNSPEGRRWWNLKYEKADRNGKIRVYPNGMNIERTDPKVLANLEAKAKSALAREAKLRNQAISLRVPVADLELARRIAAKRGVGYQAILKEAIHSGLSKA
jgi:predicted DNA binding CopG/RHH family protein